MKTERAMLIADDQVNLRESLALVFTQKGFRVFQAADGAKAMEILEKEDIGYVLCDLKMPKVDGMQVLEALGPRAKELIFILATAYGDSNIAIKALSLGATDYLAKPFSPEDALTRFRMAEERKRLEQENLALKSQVRQSLSFDNIVGKSQAMQVIFKTIEKVADYKTTVLLEGESGTGKELLARAIHANSGRRNRRFIAVNCGAIPENLLESELFGHVKGAFTDAVATKRGLIEAADGGTLFLDEIGELPLSLQVKLLRVLQEGEIRRIGDTKEISVDIRVIAATARDLAEEVKQRRFREDLYYRLNVLTIRVPPLRDRKEDVPALIEHFLRKNEKKMNIPPKEFNQEALKAMLEYPWPGNVRELENTVERALVLSEGHVIGEDALPEKVVKKDYVKTLDLPLSPSELSIKKTVRVLEKELIKRALKKTGGNRTAAAKLLEISHRTLLYKLKEYNIQVVEARQMS